MSPRLVSRGTRPAAKFYSHVTWCQSVSITFSSRCDAPPAAALSSSTWCFSSASRCPMSHALPASRSRPCRRSSMAGTAWPRQPWTASSRSSTSSATRRAWGRRACAATAPTCSASWSPSSSRSRPSCSRARPRRSPAADTSCWPTPAGTARAPPWAGSGARSPACSGTLIDGAVIVTPTVVETEARLPRRRRRPAHRAVRPAHRRLGQLRRRRAGDQLPARPSATAGSGTSADAPDLKSARLREAGFRSAMADAGVPVDERLVRVGGFRIESAAGTGRGAARPHRPADRDLRG